MVVNPLEQAKMIEQSLIRSEKEALSKPLNKEEINTINNFYSNRSKKIIITDVDEILVNIAPKWVKLTYDHKDEFKGFFKFKKDFDVKKNNAQILYRPYYRLDRWMLDERNLNKLPLSEAQKYLDKFLDLYNQPDFYDDLVPTRLGSALASALTVNKLLDKIIVISRVTTDVSADSKTRFLKRLFRGYMHKVEILYVGEKESKADAIKTIPADQLRQVAALYEDENRNVAEMLGETDLNTIQVYMPNFNYNKPSLEFENLIKENNSELKRFDYYED